MPCFHGLAVSIHTPNGPLPEYSIQKQSKFHRITSYIPVPPAKVRTGSTLNKPEQSTFAISITLLTPGLNVPYSTPKPTPEDSFPRPKVVGGLPGSAPERGRHGPVIGPYIPITSSPNETIAAYIYFDGRAKEEVATLLRRGEETWVNSRWVSVPDSEGGGLAEREFLFREVGLERWLNGLDLEGKDIAARIERRRQRLEKKRRKQLETKGSDDDDVEDSDVKVKPVERNGVLRYGDDKNSPVETLSGDDVPFSSDFDSEDEPPMPEAAGQIKVALFRVLASGEIKRGEYSPQFDAHDDDEASSQNGHANSEGDGDVDHTTSFAKPKTLDPKSISTQTVTGIDPPDKPYAVFTFLYRGERQLRKMGILSPSQSKVASVTNKKSANIDFAGLAPLTSTGTKNFASYREPRHSPTFSKNRSGKKKAGDDYAMDSDADDEDADAPTNDDTDEADVKEESPSMLSPEDALRQGELAEGVRKIKLKRQHSAEPMGLSPAARKSPLSGSPTTGTPDPTASVTPPIDAAQAPAMTPNLPAPLAPSTSALKEGPPDSIIGSPFKKQRASLPGFDDGVRRGLGVEFGSGDKGVKEESPGLAPDSGSSLDPVPSVGSKWGGVKIEMEEDL